VERGDRLDQLRDRGPQPRVFELACWPQVGQEIFALDQFHGEEWGVPFETVAIAIPFYLARPDLTALHAERVGHVEGFDRADILKYLRHEMGHVINYAYRLYDQEEWVKQFGSITQPYFEEYRPEPFSRRYVRHLPGWYAQKHPDEDWAETFAVWMTPGLDWRAEYGGWPVAYAKLTYCSRTMNALRDRDPEVTSSELDEDVAEIEYSLDQYYGRSSDTPGELPPGLDGAIRAIFEDLGSFDRPALDGPLQPAGELIQCIHVVASIPDVADRHREPPPIGARRAHEDGLFRPAARPADAAQFEYPNGTFSHDAGSDAGARGAAPGRRARARAPRRRRRRR